MQYFEIESEWIWGICAGVLFTIMLIWILVCKNHNAEHHTSIPVKTILILGSGGHSKEMLSLSESLPINIYSPRIYVHANTDELSGVKAKELEEAVKLSKEYSILSIPRSREVGQSWISSIFTTLYSIYKSIHVFYISQPKLILCNGPGVCIPICLIAYFLKIIKIHDSKIIYVESLCRVKSLSLSGLIAKRIADKFLVQSQDLANKNPDALFVGRIT